MCPGAAHVCKAGKKGDTHHSEVYTLLGVHTQQDS